MECPYGHGLCFMAIRPAGGRLDECDRAYEIYSGDMDFGYKRQTLRLKGFASIASKRIDEAEKTAGELKVAHR